MTEIICKVEVECLWDHFVFIPLHGLLAGDNEIDEMYSDAGIVYLENKPYLISVMVAAKNLSTAEAESRVNKLMDEISRKAYVFMSEGYLQ
jgi:hypothetical protein